MIGAQLGPYRILAMLGAGGMGEVYRGVDTRLDRVVAIKILPRQVANDPRRAERFARESRAVSKLNHPHICTLYDVGEHDGVSFIVMEFLEGETLARRLTRGALPLDRVVPVATEIADALVHAHRHGIIHRDLKPANIMLTPAGAKLLDFGIAALQEPATASADSATAGTGPGTLTEEGTILGTVQYMSPEQLEARPSDARTDIFAFGAIVYETATGRQAFTGASRASLIAAVLERQPELLSPAPTGSADDRAPMPWMLQQIVARCLAKDPDERFQTAADLRQALRWMTEGGAARQASLSGGALSGRRLRRAGWIGASALALGSLLVALTTLKPPVPPARPTDHPVVYNVVPPPNTSFSPSSASFALSPDGRFLAFTASEVPQTSMALWIKPLDALEPRKVAGADSAGQVFWSPDSRTVAFADPPTYALKTVDINGGLPQSIGSLRLGQIGTWSANRTTMLGMRDGLIHEIDVQQARSRAITRLDAAIGETGHHYPTILPDGRYFLYVVRSDQPQHDGAVYLASIETGQRERLFTSDSQVTYAAPGHLLYMVGNSLLTRPFDAAQRRVTGEPVRIAENVERNASARRGAFTVSQTGVLAYRQLSETQYVWFDRGGRRLGTLGPPGYYRNPALSPDGRRLATGRFDPQTGSWDVFTIEVDRDAVSRVTLNPAMDDMPVWSPDGAFLAFKSDRGRRLGIYRKGASASGSETLLFEGSGRGMALYVWSPEGIVYSSQGLVRDSDARRMPLTPGATSVPLLDTPFWEMYCQVSANGKWVAYSSNESGRFEVYVSAFPSGQGRWPVSVGGGTEPAWQSDGAELFYLAGSVLMAVPITAGDSIKVGQPRKLFVTPASPLINASYTRNQYVVSRDGERFLINQPVRTASPSIVTIVVNWTATMIGPVGS